MKVLHLPLLPPPPPPAPPPLPLCLSSVALRWCSGLYRLDLFFGAVGPAADSGWAPKVERQATARSLLHPSGGASHRAKKGKARRSRPRGAKWRYCPASRISGPPPPRQAAGDPARAAELGFRASDRDFFFTHGLRRRRLLEPFRERETEGFWAPTSANFCFQFRCGRFKTPTPSDA